MDDVVLRIGRRDLTFTKSVRFVGVEPRSAMSTLAFLPPSDGGDRPLFGDFRLVDLDASSPMPASLLLPAPDESSVGRRRRMESFVDGVRKAGGVATHVYHTSDDQVPFVPTGRLFVRLRDGTSEAERQAIFQRAGLILLTMRHGFSILQVTSASLNPMKTAAALQRDARVEIAEPDLSTPFRTFGPDVGTDVLLEDVWQLENRGEHGGIRVWFRKGADVRVRGAWNRLRTRGRAEVRVAIIDDGFLTTHPALNAAGRWAAPRNFGGGPSVTLGLPTELDPSPRSPADTHGTECAGLVGALGTDGPVVGVAPHCTLIPIRWNHNPDGLNLDDWFDHAATHDAAIVSCSWGPTAREFALPSFHEAAIRACAERARGGRGALIVFAAGNEGVDLAVSRGGWVTALTSIDTVMMIAGMDSRGERWGGSNYGTAVTLCAPAGGGGDGAPITTCSVKFVGGRPEPHVHSAFGGTSAACALVAGVAALTLSADPSLDARALRAVLTRTAWPPVGMVADSRGADVHFGFGCVDADAAVAAIYP